MRTLSKDTINYINTSVVIQGWVDKRRDHGKIVFLDLRDRTGIIQLVTDKSRVRDIRPEDVVTVTGLVKQRPEGMINPDLATGSVEIEIQSIRIESKARDLPFPIDTDGYDIEEEIRNRYRYLDLRRPRMQKNLKLRSDITTLIRNFLTDREFVEIETPILTKTTPEGARDFIVPSRLKPGKFYALPQSPQQYKQLLMVAGVERYFQFARCFRDEDPRKDRAYGEFTQLDMEMSFVTQEDILAITEELFTNVVKTVFPDKRISKTPWPRLSHREAMEKYGTDKPDLRENKNDPDELAFSWTTDFPLFTRQSEEDYFHGSGSAQYAPSHHMFTAPHSDDISLLDLDPAKVRGLQHDLVLNGFEVGGGSIRIHKAEIQEKIFHLIGFTDEQKKQFDHMLTAFGYGVPPHGGIAPGLDRFLMAALGEPSVREVIAFPTTSSGQISVMDAPGGASEEQLGELGICLKTMTQEDVYRRILSDFEKVRENYSVIEHEPVLTSEDASRIRDSKPSEGVKAILLFGDGKPLMVAVSGELRIDIGAFKRLYGIKDLRMATAEEVLAVTRVPVGAVPPFGKMFGIPLYMDERLRSVGEVVFNAGFHTKSIRTGRESYEKVAQPLVGSFSKSA